MTREIDCTFLHYIYIYIRDGDKVVLQTRFHRFWSLLSWRHHFLFLLTNRLAHAYKYSQDSLAFLRKSAVPTLAKVFTGQNVPQESLPQLRLGTFIFLSPCIKPMAVSTGFAEPVPPHWSWSLVVGPGPRSLFRVVASLGSQDLRALGELSTQVLAETKIGLAVNRLSKAWSVVDRTLVVGEPSR